MGAPFPLSPVPSTYGKCTPSAPHGVYFVGGSSPSFTLEKSGANAYSVRDYYGNVVSSGSVTGTTVSPAAPSGGWKPGWYRLYVTGPTNDSVFGFAYGSSNFVVLRTDSRFHNTFAAGTDSFKDLRSKGNLGMGTSRLELSHADNPTGAVTYGDFALADVQNYVTTSKTYWTVASGDAYYDSARTRYAWVAFPNGTSDHVTIGNLNIYCKDETIDGATVTVTAAAGTSSGTKITITAGTTETYDNLADANAAATALAASAYVRGFASGNSLGTLSATAIGHAYFNGVKLVVSTLYPDVTRFEGPTNEPLMNAETAHKMRLFQAAVHGGNASAKAIGPCPVNIGGIGTGTEAFFAAGGGAYCDEISVHGYNSQTYGDINLGRKSWSDFQALLAKYGQASKPIWQTESTQAMINVYGVYHPRRARIVMLQTLLLEQFGIPRERNNVWYDISGGFWSYPTWWQEGDQTFAPYTALFRVLAEETFGTVHTSTMSFGTIGDKVFLGSIYAGASSKLAVIMAQSSMPTANGGAGATVTLSVSGTTAPLTVVDGFGNTSTVNIVNGLATIPVAEIPTYVRLPLAASVTVHHCNDWPSNTAGWISNAANPAVSVSGAAAGLAYVNDGQWLQAYGGGVTDGYALGTTVPDSVTLQWPSAVRFDRVLLWSGGWQNMSCLVDFDIQTSNDGSTWTTQATVTRSTPSSFLHGADAGGTGCQRETYWDEQWIHDVKLSAPLTVKYVRLYVRATSYGGEPDAAAVTSGGQGRNTQAITLQEMAVLCDANANGTGGSGSGPYGARL